MSETRVDGFGEGSLIAATARGRVLSATAILAGLAAIKLFAQFAGVAHYGFFRDELYYMACGQHLAWGYIDQPPLIALVAWFERHLFGNSLLSVRLLPILAGAAVVFLTGILAREFGARRYGQFLAASAILWAPAYFAFDSFLSMNAFEPLFWLLCACIVARIVKGASPKWWLAFGAVAGIGIENKHTMILFGFALVAGLILAGQARLLLSKWIWIGGAIALALFLPNLLWEASHDWPQIEVVRNAQLYKNIPISPLRFLADQILFLSPIALPVWTGGLVWLLFSAKGRPFRFFGFAYLIVVAVFIVLDGKSYYVLPAYPMLMAAGGAAIEDLVEANAWRWLRTALPVLLVIAGLVALPFGVPVLPVDAFLRYSRVFPYANSVKTERDAVDVQLPQLYADMFGWENIADGSLAGLPRSPGSRPRRLRDPGGELRRGGRHRLLRPRARPAACDQRPQQLLRLGPARLHRLMRDRIRRALRRIHAIFPRRAARRHHHQRPHDAHRVLDQRLHLPPADRAAEGALAAFQNDYLIAVTRDL